MNNKSKFVEMLGAIRNLQNELRMKIIDHVSDVEIQFQWHINREEEEKQQQQQKRSWNLNIIYANWVH